MSNSLRLVAFLVLFFNNYSTYAEDTYGPVKAGDILWHIAAQVSSSNNASRYQTMLALLKANPHAFAVSCNVNSLKVGAILKMPSPQLIHATAAKQATKLINEQFTAWKNRRTTPIVCKPIEEAPPQVKPENNLQLDSLSVIPTLKVPAEQNLATVEEKILEHKSQQPVVSTSQETTTLESSITVTPVEIKQPIILETSNTTSSIDMLKDVAKNNLKLLIIIGGILVIFILLLLLMLVFVLFKLTSKKISEPEEQHSTVFSRVYEEKPIQPKQSASRSDNDLKDKLAVIRTCLAEGEEAVQVLLKDVLDKGSDEQQHEARQLIEINKKIHKLEQYKQPEDDLQQVVKMSQYLPQTNFSPENKQQVFMLIDKIFELLDHELHANGQLVEAYTQRHQAEFFDQNIRPEKVLVEKDAEPHHTAHHSHSTEKATRYL
ncbi:FimV/HubP family polar landmark protein [Candidatus Albibeggiatoa sp. nov. NOAA]|uniref:FimV/HubP family polar landmark protein n=1 Tax=Candidatus Albibeggiatoa sp. nov. NOAA TaxID=3162724 RepID=UPI0032F6B211|nr:hypothetical protein [Thiotrichaceae bacterium]